MMIDICIIGGGASGLAAAVSAAEQKQGRVLILEKKQMPGKKIAASGNGRCNLTNRKCSGALETLDFFASLGVFTYTDGEGRVYPNSNQAKDVVYALVRAAKSLGVELKTECTVEKILPLSGRGGFQVRYKGGTLEAKKVLLACGGKAGPQFGTSGDGYGLAKALGHKVTRLAPILTGLETRENLKQLKGVRAMARVGLRKDGKLMAEETGEVQFNEDGISGICVMNLSRQVKLEPGETFAEGIARYQICFDFLPEMDWEETLVLLRRRQNIMELAVEDLFLSIVPSKLKQVLAEKSGLACGTQAALLSEGEVESAARILKSWTLSLSGVKGWNYAQCTSGGIPFGEVNGDTMESRLIPGLYFSGEILDFDGPCGGFNLQHAWETGRKAGKAMANAISNSSD